MTKALPGRPAIIGLLATGLLALAITGYAATRVLGGDTPDFNGTPYPDAPAAPDFALTDDTGSPLRLASLHGRVVLLFFGFTSCPDVCPVTLATLARVLAEKEWPPEEVQVLLITVDPATDTPEKLASYVGQFGPNVRGLTGSPEALATVQREYGVFARMAPGHDGVETLAHTTLVFGIDRAGRLQVLMHPEEGDEPLAEDIEELVGIE